MHLVGETSGRQVLLSCRENQQPDSAYRARLNPDRRTASISRRVRGQSQTLAEAPSDAIFRGEATNHVEFQCAGDRLSVNVNGVEVASVRDDTFTEGLISLGLDRASTGEARFGSLVVQAAAPPPTTAAPTGPSASAPPRSDTEMVSRVTPSVVQVLVPFGAGSGVKLSQGIVTNAHVVQGADRIEVVAGDGRRSTATVVSFDGRRDLALLSADLNVPPLDSAPARSLRQGETLFVLGYPRSDVLGGQASLTRGIVSAIREMDQGLLVQTDAAVNPGNSGGPMINSDGKVVAIATWRVRGAEGLNMGVATETLQEFLSSPAILPKPGPTPFPQGPNILADNFDTPAIGVLPSSSDDPSRYRRGYVSGEYQVQILDPTLRGAGATVPGIYGDAAISVDARILPASSEGAFVALVCRGQVGAALSGYSLSIRPGDRRFVLVKVGGQAPLASGVSDAIRGPGDTNHFELRCTGTTISAAINGVSVASTDDSAYSSGSMVILVGTSSGTAEARFDNLVVSAQ